MGFTKATKKQLYGRIAIDGPSGSGKTYTALRIARGLGKKIALADSEFRSASLYANEFDFDTLDLSADCRPIKYIGAIRDAVAGGYDVLILDSLSHAWDATIKEVDKIAKSMQSKNSFVAWGPGGKLWDDLKNEIKAAPIHIIATMRSKMEYTQGEKNGKKVVEKMGMAPEVRQGSEYEYDIILSMNQEHFGNITKTRCSILSDTFYEKPGEELGHTILEWLTSGEKETIQTPPSSQPVGSATTQGQQPTQPQPHTKKDTRTPEEIQQDFDNYIERKIAEFGHDEIELILEKFRNDNGELSGDLKAISLALEKKFPTVKGPAK